MKWMPMKRSGRSVAEASRVIEIDEVLVARIAAGLRCLQTAVVDLELRLLVLGRSLDDEVALAEAGQLRRRDDALERPLAVRLGDDALGRPAAPCCR